LLVEKKEKYKSLLEHRDKLIKDLRNGHEQSLNILTDEYDKVIQELSAQLDLAKDVNAALEEKLKTSDINNNISDALKAQVEKGNVDLALAQKDSEEKGAEIVTLKANLDAIQMTRDAKLVQVKQMDDLRKSIKVLETEFQKVKKEKETLETLEKAKAKIEKGNVDLALAQKDSEEKEAEIVNLKSNLEAIQMTSDAKLVQVNQDANQAMDDLRKSSMVLETEFQKVKKEKETLEKAIATIETRVKTQAAMVLKGKEAEIEKLKAKFVQVNKENEQKLQKAKLEHTKKGEIEVEKVKKDKIKIETKLNKALGTAKDTKKTLEEKKAEIDALKTELKKTHSSLADKTSSTTIMVASHKEKEAEIVQLKVLVRIC
jgi:chromosome segregation ATPase